MDFELQTSDTKETNENIRILLVTIAVAFLNLGLFLILTYFAAVIAGMVAGYLIRKRRTSILSAFVGSVGAYLFLFILQADALLEYIIEAGSFIGIPEAEILPIFWTALILASLMISLLGVVGAFIGHAVRPKDKVETMYQQSDDLV